MNPRLFVAALMSMFSGSPKRKAKTSRGKATPELINKRTAAKSQRVQRIERGMRPRDEVGKRDRLRRARHAVVGAPK